MTFKNKKLRDLAIAASLGTGVVFMPAIAQAELTGNIAVANMYLWRGLDISPDGGQVSGGLDYAHESGFYAGVWTSSELQGTETDLYLGFAKEFSGFNVDVSYWDYLYPENLSDTGEFVDLTKNDITEFVIGLSYAPVSFNAYIEGENQDYIYYTLSAEYEQFSATYGIWQFDADGANNYSHLTLSYAPVDDFTFSVSFAFNDTSNDKSPGNGDPSAGDAVETDPLFMVSWSKSFDIMK
jgi:uncharacterized protein (TIGR02001 family)